jgi:hypothetical protein
MKSKTETLLPNRKQPYVDRLLPSLANPRTDKLDCMVTAPPPKTSTGDRKTHKSAGGAQTDSPDPIRINEPKLMEDPKCARSKTDSEEPSRAIPYTDNADPILQKLRNDSDEESEM